MHASTPGIETILAQAVEITAPGERQAFVERACAGDAELQRRVERLIERHFQSGSFLEQPAVDLAALGSTPSAASACGPGTVLGPYRLLELLGEGGMGLVYVAQQQQPLQRRVALKLIKPGMDSKQVIARFEAERQALALMDHPHIARVYDGGTTPEGRPYFVMELVRGTPITEYCDQQRLGTRERLGLFQDVCAAVQHAHQKGIIHRDLKPSNVLVSVHDVRPVVKVIDFGVAKALGAALTDKTLFTALAQLVGTPLYMSPEQAGLSDLDVDTRSDIYSLGVLLYELLTGTTPFDSESLKQAGYDEMRRIIREDEPPRPSSRLSTLQHAALSTIAERRGLEPRRLRQQLRGELDWIVMKALEKDRNRRYESASTLAADVERYLADEPVLACPPSQLYRLRKFARRHREWLAVAACVLGVLALGAGVLWRDLGQRGAAEASVEAALKQAELLRQQEHLQAAAAVLAVAQGQLAGRGLGVLPQRVEQARRAIDMLMSLEQARVQHSDAGKKLDFDFPGSVLLYAQAFERYGLEVRSGEPEEAARRVRASAIQERLTEALDDWAYCREKTRDPEGAGVLRAIARLADDDPWRQRLRELAGRADRAALEALAQQEDTLSRGPASLVWLARALSDGRSLLLAERLLRQVQARYPADFWINFDLANLLYGKKNPGKREALRFCQAALAVRPENVAVLNTLGNILAGQGNRAEAEAAYRKAIELNPENARVYTSLGNLLDDLGRLSEAEAALHKAIALKPDFGEAYVNLGVVFSHQGKLNEAETAFRKGIALRPDLSQAHNDLAVFLMNEGKLAEAESAFRQAVTLKPDDALIYSNLGTVLIDRGKAAEAEAAYRKAIELQPDYAIAYTNLCDLLHDQGKLAEAEVVCRKALALEPDFVLAHGNLGRVLLSQGKPQEAARSFQEAVRVKPDAAESNNMLAWFLATCADARFRDPAKAVVHARKAVKLTPADGNCWNTLGKALYRNGDWQAAVQSLTKSIELNKGGESTDFFFLAMAHWQLHEKDRARAWYEKAVAWMDQHKPQDAESKRFRAEATALFGLAKDAAPAKKP